MYNTFPSLIYFSRPVHDFESLVSPADFDRLKDFVYIDSKETLDAFSAFVYGLKVKKITGERFFQNALTLPNCRI
jgi:hypothetical protein